MGEWSHRPVSVSVSVDVVMAWILVATGATVESLCAFNVIAMRFWLLGQMALLLGCTLHVTRLLRDRQAAIRSAFDSGQKSAVRTIRP